ncbi:MAG: hypothetical protein ABMB14_12740, partial [Myxococcota bacterium]
VLATGRRALALAGERRFEVVPLSDDDAVRLFRARAHDDDTGDHEVRSLVGALDRLPLAIELAAGRRRTLTVRQIAERLHRRLELLTGGAVDLPPRRRSLAASLDVSWGLSSPAERRTLAVATVFRGGFTLEAAEAVIDLSAIPGAPWVVDLLDGLVALHLLRVEGDRYTMLDSVRDYAAGKLGPSDRDHAVRLHGRWYATAPDVGWTRAIEELPNLGEAVSAALGRGDREIAVGAAVRAAEVRYHHGPPLGIDALDRLIAEGPDPTGALHLARGSLLARLATGGDPEPDLEAAIGAAQATGGGRIEALAALRLATWRGERADVATRRAEADRALAAADRCGDDRIRCAALRLSGRAALTVPAGLAIGEGRLREALAVARRLGDRTEQASALGGLAYADLLRGRLASSADRWTEVIALHDRDGARLQAAVARMELSTVQIRNGEWAAAEATLGVALDDARAAGDLRTQATCLGNRAVARRRSGRPRDALDDARATVALVAPLTMPRREALARIQLAQALDAAGEAVEAQAEAERALALAERHGDAKLVGEVLLVLADGPDEVALLQRAVRSFREVDQARLAEALARLAVADPDLDAALHALAEARAVVARIDPPPVVRRLLEQAEGRLRVAAIANDSATLG